MAEVCGEQNLKVIVVKNGRTDRCEDDSSHQDWRYSELKEYVILAGKSGIKGLNVERMPKERWDNEYRIVWEVLTEKNFLN